MACYEVNLISVEFQAKHIEVLKLALKRIGLSFEISNNIIYLDNGMTLNLDAGNAEIRDYQQDNLNQIKREYSMIAVELIAKKKRWAMKVINNKIKLKRY